MNLLPLLLDRLRRAAALSALAAFALIQGVSPLLHTHVAPSAADGQVGIHLPIAVVHEGHGHASATSSIGVALEESGAITAPTEHRRNEAGAGDRPGTAPVAAMFAPARAPAPLRFESGRVAAGGGLHLRPPAQAPPASV
jgi:hypothetical protein